MTPLAPHGKGLDLFTSTALGGGQVLSAEWTFAKGADLGGKDEKEGV